jgi:hypothetical protein
MFDKRYPPAKFPCSLKIADERFKIASQEHYNYLNEKADKLYQMMFGYMSQPDLDYFCSPHPQESNCFCTALVMDDWVAQHPFNEE